MSDAFSQTEYRAAAVVCLLIGLSTAGCQPWTWPPHGPPRAPSYDPVWSDHDSRNAETLDLNLPTETATTATEQADESTPPSEAGVLPEGPPDPGAFFSAESSNGWENRNAFFKRKFPVWRDLLAGVEETEGAGRRGWILDRRQPAAAGVKPPRRWYYPALEEMLYQASEDNVDPTAFLLAALGSGNLDVVTNAAIALSRSGNSLGMPHLVEAVSDSNRSLPMRYAAAEALGSLRTPSPSEELRKLVARHGPPTPDRPRLYIPELHAALLRSLTEHVADPAAEPCFLLVLQAPFPPALRREVAPVKVDVLGAFATVPVERLSEPTRQAIARSLNEGDPRVRIAALEVIGQADYPGAYPLLSRSLRDSQADVRTAALAGLGRLGGDQSAATLEETLQHYEEAMREAAVLALASMGRETPVLGAAQDGSSRVRLAVARSLRQFPTPEATAVAMEMIDGRSSHVQLEIVQSVREWPLRMAGPVLLKAIARPGYPVRYEAHSQLVAANWPPAVDFDPAAPAGQRADDVERLTGLFAEQFGFAPTSRPVQRQLPLSQRVSAEQLTLVEPLLRSLAQADTPQSVRRAAIADLIALGPGLVEVLELLAIERRLMLPDTVYREVLPSVQPEGEFDMLDRLTSGDVVLRRRAATGLEKLALAGPFGDLAMLRLADVVVYETDPLVWQSVLRAIASDPREPAVRLSYAATGHATSEVRRLACLYLTTHPGPAHVSVLVPLLTDAKTTVACQAARALGLSGSPAAISPLRKQLARPDEPLRAELALALARLGDPSGIDALELLSHSRDETILRTVAISMGEIADPVFIPLLIRMLDDRQSVRIAAMESLPKVVDRDVAKSSDDRIRDFSERCEAWKRWFEREYGRDLAGMK